MVKGNIKLPVMTVGKSIGFLAGGTSALIVVIFCWHLDDLITSLFALCGACSGWMIGILVAPLSNEEKENFGVISKVVSGFVTGYLLSKIDPIISSFFAINITTGAYKISDPVILERILVTLASFLVAVLLVFNARSYWSEKR